MSLEDGLPILEPKKKIIPASCTLCSYYSPNMTDPNGHGVCRRNPPTVYPIPNGVLTMWPTVKPMDWCGEGDPGISHDSRKAGEMILKEKGNGNRH